MSGFEIAGAALAAFPILIDGVNHLVKGAETMHRWKRYKLKLKEYAHILESAKVHLDNTLEALLIDIVSSDEELKLLLSDPGGSMWGKQEYDEKLRRRLDRSYESYFKTIRTLRSNTAILCDKLGVDNVGGDKWHDYSLVERQLQRIKVTFSINMYRDLLDKIRDANTDLERFTKHNSDIELKRKRLSKRPIANLKLIRKHAASLYKVFMTEEAWKCTCKLCHMASLQLETRPQTAEGTKADNIPQRYTFRLLLSMIDMTDKTRAISRWDEIEVIPSLEDKVAVDEIQRPVTSMNSKSRPATRAVSFAPEIDSSLAETHIERSAAEISQGCVEDFCSLLRTPDRTNEVLGLLIDKDNDKHKHKLYRVDTFIDSGISSISLGQILKDSQRRSPDEGLFRIDRLRIAVTLASSVLQLDGTSWLKNQWTCDDILFHSIKGQPEVMEYTRPYLSWQRCCSTAIPSLNSLRLGIQTIRNDVLLALGLALVELCFGRTLGDMWKPNDGDINDMITRVNTATRLHGSVYREMGIPYGEAVRRCLFQPFDVRELSLDVEEVQQKVLDDIVSPLVVELNNFNGYPTLI